LYLRERFCDHRNCYFLLGCISDNLLGIGAKGVVLATRAKGVGPGDTTKVRFEFHLELAVLVRILIATYNTEDMLGWFWVFSKGFQQSISLGVLFCLPGMRCKRANGIHFCEEVGKKKGGGKIEDGSRRRSSRMYGEDDHFTKE
jgi:hypothetical protein